MCADIQIHKQYYKQQHNGHICDLGGLYPEIMVYLWEIIFMAELFRWVKYVSLPRPVTSLTYSHRKRMEQVGEVEQI